MVYDRLNHRTFQMRWINHGITQSDHSECITILSVTSDTVQFIKKSYWIWALTQVSNNYSSCVEIDTNGMHPGIISYRPPGRESEKFIHRGSTNIYPYMRNYIMTENILLRFIQNRQGGSLKWIYYLGTPNELVHQPIPTCYGWWQSLHAHLHTCHITESVHTISE